MMAKQLTAQRYYQLFLNNNAFKKQVKSKVLVAKFDPPAIFLMKECVVYKRTEWRFEWPVVPSSASTEFVA